MYKVPAKYKKTISNELKKFVPLVNTLQAKGKSSSEDDARILLNDILAYVLGYDKYNELKTELRERSGRFDYVVKLSAGPLAKKPDRFDFVIEAKAAHITLSQNHVDQTLSYCLSKGMDFFVLTNAVCWQLYSVKHSKKQPEAKLIHEVDFGTNKSIESLTEEFYLFSKASYLNGDWAKVAKHSKATNVDDVVAVLLSDKIVKSISKELTNQSGIKVSSEAVKDILENQIVKSEVDSVNKKLLKKLNQTKPKKVRKTANNESVVETSDETDVVEEPKIEETAA